VDMTETGAPGSDLRSKEVPEKHHTRGPAFADSADDAAGLGRPHCGHVDASKSFDNAKPSPTTLESDDLAALRARAMAAVKTGKTAKQDSAARMSSDNMQSESYHSESVAALSQEDSRAESKPLEQPRSLSTSMQSDTDTSVDMDVPDDAAVVSVHASKAASLVHTDAVSPSNLGSRRPQGPSQEPRMASAKEKSVHCALGRPEDQILQLQHGAVRPTKAGFVGKGPFWTYDSNREHPSPKLQSSQAGSHSQDSQSSSAGVFRHHGACIGGDSPFPITKFVGNCIDLLAGALNAGNSSDNAPPEEELTTVLLETQEQRLQWREFLSEAVSKSCASNMYSAFDVEAEPPRYARPPLSVALPDGAAKHLVEATAEVPVVAPQGAGWSPILGGPSAVSIQQTEQGPASTTGIQPAMLELADPAIPSRKAEEGECCVCKPQAPAAQLNPVSEGSSAGPSTPPPAG